jgi:xanthine dehydrogenase accessory protein XdhC
MIGAGDLAAKTLAEGGAAVLVRVAVAEGSTPREAGATMVVTAAAMAGTIGGGHLEFHAIAMARQLIAGSAAEACETLPLGPLMGQCCGGRVRLDYRRLDAAAAEALRVAEVAERAARPQVLVFGAGHTGRALALALAPLPVAVALVDDRAAVFGGMPAEVCCRRLNDPVAAVADAAPGAAYFVMTHSHALDFRVAEAALLRGDAAYVGMIGSATKRARFLRAYRQAQDVAAVPVAFVCPIGGKVSGDKRPAVIAALAVAEIIGILLAGRTGAARPRAAGRAGAMGGG